MKRTPGKKVSQGFQLLAIAAKYRFNFLTKTGTPFKVGTACVHQFVFDLSKGVDKTRLLIPGMANIYNLVIYLCKRVVPPGGKFYRLWQDNRFNTPKLPAILYGALRLFCTGTIKMNMFPLGKELSSRMIPPEWTGKSITENKKKDLRLQPPRVCRYGGLTLVFVFDQGLTKMVTTLPTQINQYVDKEKQRRSFLEVKRWKKLQLADKYSNAMDPVDIVDHRASNHPVRLQSHKWTWSPICAMLTESILFTHSLHIMLCSSFNVALADAIEQGNEHGPLHSHKDYCRPLTSKEFYRKLGLVGMEYSGNSGYWCEPRQVRAWRERVAAAGAAVATGAAGAGAATGAGVAAAVGGGGGSDTAGRASKNPSLLRRAAQEEHRFDGAGHTLQRLPASQKGNAANATCAYCKVRSANWKCIKCKVPLHMPTGLAAWPCRDAYHNKRRRKSCASDKEHFKAADPLIEQILSKNKNRKGGFKKKK